MTTPHINPTNVEDALTEINGVFSHIGDHVKSILSIWGFDDSISSYGTADITQNPDKVTQAEYLVVKKYANGNIRVCAAENFAVAEQKKVHHLENGGVFALIFHQIK